MNMVSCVYYCLYWCRMTLVLSYTFDGIYVYQAHYFVTKKVDVK